MKSMLTKKLQLKKETISRLSDMAMIQIKGGETENCTNEPPTEELTLITCGKPILW